MRQIPEPLTELGFRGHDVLTADGTSTFVVRGGTGRPVVLLHGYPQDWTVWSGVMADLVDTYDVVVPVLPGIGASQIWPGGSSTPALADWLASVLTVSGIAGPVTVVGHDVGAWVAAAFAAARPQQLTELMLIDAFLPGISDPAALALRPDSPLWHMHLHAHTDAARVLIAGQLRAFLAWFLRSKSGTPDIFPDSRIDYSRLYTARRMFSMRRSASTMHWPSPSTPFGPRWQRRASTGRCSWSVVRPVAVSR
jgi:pimeloyl-ACP methyl ester carboxylesterase